MEHDKTLVLRNLILRDYSVVRDEMKKRNKSLFDDFVELERQKENYNFDSYLILLDKLHDFVVNDLNSPQTSKRDSILKYLDKL